MPGLSLEVVGLFLRVKSRVKSLRMERETGIEPATSSLGSWRSTAELLPLAEIRPILTQQIKQLSPASAGRGPLSSGRPQGGPSRPRDPRLPEGAAAPRDGLWPSHREPRWNSQIRPSIGLR